MNSAPSATPPTVRLRLAIHGAVQGVGFRPFVFRLAAQLGLAGWINNGSQGVRIEVEGGIDALREFLRRIELEKPPRSFIQSLEASWLDAVGYADFEIRASDASGDKTAIVLPDVATCPDCLKELFDPADRRYRYPFTNCTHCGPRFSIIEALPYDRANTSMRRFRMCAACQAEYDDPRHRRFHAQPNACPDCGPHLALWDASGSVLVGADRAGDYEALSAAAGALRDGRIVAVKGLGGFHLMVAAHDEAAVRCLRERKHREEKPFALMFPSLEPVRRICVVTSLEERLLRSAEAPIVLLRRSTEAMDEEMIPIADAVAPGNPNLGVMLPYTPLHHLLLADLGFPVVATSGNLSDEPICTDEREALDRLAGVADLFLVHDRPIVRHVDDSIVRVMLERELMLRRARGYAPLPITLTTGPAVAPVLSAEESGPGQPRPLIVRSWAGDRPTERESPTILAVGAHLKNSVALAVGSQAFISQHIGDLETAQSWEAFQRVCADLPALYAVQPEIIAADLHPDYLSTKFAVGTGRPMIRVQHHLAHVLACMAENELSPPVLGVAWDGTGYGPDGTVWGGEFFRVTETSVERFAHLRGFRLPGGDQAVKEPRRAALGWLFEAFGDSAFALDELAPVRSCSKAELATFKTMLERRLNSPITSSVGRLFDAVASLAGLRQRAAFEGQAAMELEWALDGMDGMDGSDSYEWKLAESAPEDLLHPRSSRGDESPLGQSSGPASGGSQSLLTSAPTSQSSSRRGPRVLDWTPMLNQLLADLRGGRRVGEISAAFHNGLAESIVAVARAAGLGRVALSGGCFQNRYLTERAVTRLRAEGFQPYWHQRIPPNDGGIGLGQIVAARR